MSKVSMRTSCPSGYNKNYMRTANGGWNTCIKGKPTKADANVLANCVGYASGRFNEIINIARGTSGCTYKTLNCNAEYFIERAKAAGLKTGSDPRVGAIMCWQKGPLGGNGAGHVAIVERVNNKDSVYTSESGYGSSYFWNATRTRNSGNGWGIGRNYKFRAFIYLPDDVQKIVNDSGITPNVVKDIYKHQIEVKVTDLRLRIDAGTDKTILGFASKGYYNFYDTKDASGYKWYRIADGQWIASNDNWTTVYPAQPKPTPTYKYNIGDKVVINGQLYGNADGDNPGKTVSNRITNITRIAEGHPYPYNTTGDLDWMAESSISPYIPTPTPNPTPTPTPTELKVGDTVKIVGGGRASSYGDKPVAGGIGWTRTILKIYKGRPYPNQVGNKTGTTGFYKDDALKKL